MTREEALRYVKSAAGHLIITDRKVVGMALLEAWDALRDDKYTTTTSWYSKKLYCDACEERIVGKKQNYCPMCGRKLEG
jgi:uncharacterized paraquat-inducible protein A